MNVRPLFVANAQVAGTGSAKRRSVQRSARGLSILALIENQLSDPRDW